MWYVGPEPGRTTSAFPAGKPTICTLLPDMTLIPRVLPLLFFLLPLCAQAAYKVQFDAPRELESLLEDNLELVRYQDRDDLSEAQVDFLIATVPEQIAKLLATEGYFSAETKVETSTESGRRTVMLTVVPNKRTMVSETDIRLNGQISSESPNMARRLVRNWSLPKGEPFTQTDWSNAKDDMLNIMQDYRYAAARLTSSRATIDPETTTAILQAEYDSGPSFSLGKLHITGLARYPRSIIDNVNPLAYGEPYSVSRLQALQQQIRNTPYFSNVNVSIDDDPARAENTPINVHVTEYPTQLTRIGVGYSTDIGGQTEARYTHNNVLGKALVFDSKIKWEQERQLGSVSLSTPPESHSYIHSVGFAMDRTTLQGVDLRSKRIRIDRTRSRELYDTAFSLTYYVDELTNENGAVLPTGTVTLPGKHHALVPGFQWSRRNVNNPVFPRSGNLITAELGLGMKQLMSDQTFGRIALRVKQYYPLFRRDVFILHGQIGAVITDGRATSVPPSLLFRAGGSDSVRGYSYQSIGNQQNGIVYPTKYMAIGSAEYQHWFLDNWGAALFYDLGTAADAWTGKGIYQGTGAGVRWRSPVGILQADLAYGFKNDSIKPHISLGIAF